MADFPDRRHRERPLTADLVVELTVPLSDAELAADTLWASGATALEWRDGAANATLVASFPTPDAARLVAVEVGGRLVEVDPGWRDAWRAFARPVEVGARLLVAPGWRDVPVGGGRLVLAIDPGGSFGSGSHPSTRMVLAALDRTPPAGLRVLDVGCGSGILSVAAARLGAAEVVGVDIEPEAVEVTAANAARNGVGEKVTALATPVAELAGRFDVALVNVTAAVHAALGAAVLERLEPGGRLVLAGLLPGQWRHVAGAYPRTTVVERLALDGWEGVELAAPAGTQAGMRPRNPASRS